MLEADQRCECVITNISDRGAHISIADSDALPDSFVLLLAENGATRRRCRVILRKPLEFGIKFDSWLDERIRAGVSPNSLSSASVGMSFAKLSIGNRKKFVRKRPINSASASIGFGSLIIQAPLVCRASVNGVALFTCKTVTWFGLNEIRCGS